MTLDELLEKFPQGRYEFSGDTVDDEEIEGIGFLSHAIPAGPDVSAQVGPNHFVRIHWSTVNAPPQGFPNLPIVIRGYQVLVGSFEVIVPSTANFVTLPPEFVASLAPGQHDFEVLAIERSGNQTITQGSFDL